MNIIIVPYFNYLLPKAVFSLLRKRILHIRSPFIVQFLFYTFSGGTVVHFPNYVKTLAYLTEYFCDSLTMTSLRFLTPFLRQRKSNKLKELAFSDYNKTGQYD